MKVLQWCRANAMPVIAVLAAAVTAVFVPPDSAYLGYYDVKTLSCLFGILAVVCALRGAGLFPLLAQRLVRAFHTARSAVTALVVVTLIGSMLLTNDTALLTFLPLSWFVLEGHRADEAHGADVHIAELRRQSGRDADALRQSAEPIPI